MSEKELRTVEQKTVVFYGDELIAVRASDGQIYVMVDQMCKVLGLTTAPQTRRIKRNEVLTDGYSQIAVYPTKLTKTVSQRRQTGLLRVDLVPLWLTGISTNAVKEEVQDKLKRFQKEAAKVLWEAFQEGRLTSEPTLEELLARDSPAAQAYKMAQAILTLARQQLLLESRVDAHEERLERIEATLGDPEHEVTPEQASQISQAVKAIALTLGKKTKRNEYGAVYGEMYRKFGITGYKLLPAKRFRECMGWLTEWHESLITDSF